jgi:cytochrome c oxidase assembly protein subunit 11
VNDASSPPAAAAPTPPRAEPGLSLAWIAALVLVPVCMLLFALFFFKPLYQLWCRATGTALRPNDPGVAAAAGVHTGRFIKVYFEANVCDGLPVRFWPEQTSQEVEVGVDGRNVYHFHNLSDKTVRFRPVHYLTPINASTQFGMKVCFCFNDQEMAPGESKEYPVVYTFAPELDARIKTVSICYTLFEKKDTEADDQLSQRIEKTVGEKGGVVSPRKMPEPQAPAAPTGDAPARPAEARP